MDAGKHSDGGDTKLRSESGLAFMLIAISKILGLTEIEQRIGRLQQP